MNPCEQLLEGQVQSQSSQQQEVQEHAVQKLTQKTDSDRTEHGTWRSEAVSSGLEKGLDALFKAHDHLNRAADQGGDGLSTMIDGIGRSLQRLQRELSQVIYRLNNGG
jgi:hypothetical protein